MSQQILADRVDPGLLEIILAIVQITAKVNPAPLGVGDFSVLVLQVVLAVHGYSV
jgi:hypothetical protein